MDFCNTKITKANSTILLYTNEHVCRSFGFNNDCIPDDLFFSIVISHGKCYNKTTPIIRNHIDIVSSAVKDDDVLVPDKCKTFESLLLPYECDFEGLGRLGVKQIRRIILVCRN